MFNYRQDNYGKFRKIFSIQVAWIVCNNAGRKISCYRQHTKFSYWMMLFFILNYPATTIFLRERTFSVLKRNSNLS